MLFCAQTVAATISMAPECIPLAIAQSAAAGCFLLWAYWLGDSTCSLSFCSVRNAPGLLSLKTGLRPVDIQTLRLFRCKAHETLICQPPMAALELTFEDENPAFRLA